MEIGPPKNCPGLADRDKINQQWMIRSSHPLGLELSDEAHEF